MEGAPKLDPLTETALRSMHDIALPTPVSWMPQTWGWGLVAAVIAAILATWAVVAIRRYRRNAYRREALSLLGEAAQQVRNPATRVAGLDHVGELLKRTALAAWPRKEVASISGSEWIDFIRGSSEDEGSEALARLLNDIEYRGADVNAVPANVGDDIVDGARRWIETHHVRA